MDIAEHETAYEITAELPGMDESNIDVKFSDGTLTIKGEKKDEREEKQKDYHLSERRYGSFQRSFGVPDGVDADNIEAHFKNGVLTVTLPKRPRSTIECRSKRAGEDERLLRQEKSLFNNSVRASFPARLADAVVSK